MNTLQLHERWLNELLPDGLAYPSSTVITGPGGSGKPLVGLAIVRDWVMAGGAVILMPLQYPDGSYARRALQRLYGVDLEDYAGNVIQVQFAHDITAVDRIQDNTFRANLLKPDVWNDAVAGSERLLSGRTNGHILVFASALNLLLFSPTYRELSFDHIMSLLRDDKQRTYLFSVSTSAFPERIRKWEEAADNLLSARLTRSMPLYVSIHKIRNRRVPLREAQVPLQTEVLEELRDAAEMLRTREIQQLRRI